MLYNCYFNMTTCFAEQKFSCHDFCFVEIEDTNTLMRTAEQRPLKMLDKKVTPWPV